jgi:hypothetical protein
LGERESFFVTTQRPVCYDYFRDERRDRTTTPFADHFVARGIPSRGAMDVASLFGARHPAHAEDLRVATASARTAHAGLACLFVATMVGFTLLRAAGLKRVLVPRSGIIGVGVAWTIVTGTFLALRASDADALALAPGTPAHALAVVFPAQTAFLSSLVRRRLARNDRAAKLAFAFGCGLVALNLARAIGASAPEVLRGAKRSDGTHETLDVVKTTVDVLVALARAAAGILLVLAGATTKSGKAIGSRQELFLSICWCVVVLVMALPLGSDVVPFADPLGGGSYHADASKRAAKGFTTKYAVRAFVFCAAHWFGLLTAKLAPGQYRARREETKETKETKAETADAKKNK